MFADAAVPPDQSGRPAQSKPAVALSVHANALLIYICGLGGERCFVYAPKLKAGQYRVIPEPDFDPTRRNLFGIHNIPKPEFIYELVRAGMLREEKQKRNPDNTLFLVTEEGRRLGAGIKQ